jgi:hypothetical protein
MGRKNKNVRRKNIKGRLDRRERGDFTNPPRVKQQPRVQIEDLVLPDGLCRFQTKRKPKARFATEQKAQKALEQAQRQRARVGSAHVEKRFYPCPEGGCGGYHLTSREEYDEGQRTRLYRQRQERGTA